jgi:AcrR family transcriptional regulator
MFTGWINIQTYILKLEQEGKVTRTFRRLDAGRQQAIINAILAEATEKGPASLNIKEIARRAGVAVGSLYQYFPNRDGLLDFVVELCVRYMTDLFNLSRPYLLAMPLREAINAYLTYGVEWGHTETGLVRFFGRAAYQGDPDLAERVVRPVAVAMREIVHEMLAQAAQRGEIRPDVDVDAAARVINALLIAVGDSQLLPYLNNYFQVTEPEMPPARVLDALIALVLDGIGPLKSAE